MGGSGRGMWCLGGAGSEGQGELRGWVGTRLHTQTLQSAAGTYMHRQARPATPCLYIHALLHLVRSNRMGMNYPPPQTHKTHTHLRHVLACVGLADAAARHAEQSVPQVRVAVVRAGRACVRRQQQQGR